MDSRKRGCAAFGAAAVLCATPLAARPAQDPLADLSLEELSNLEITSVSKRAERLSDAPASIFVITANDIRRSGAASLPEALRLAPNLQVARIDAGQYAITARGFNNAIGNKLLVLIDGRTVYTPFFSGVFWDQQDVMLEDVERIEVISGPGAVLWGANAVNGVINVITRSSADTLGTLAVAGGGNREDGAALRHGGTLADSGHFRVYGKATQMQNTRTADGSPVADGRDGWQAGFRTDWAAASGSLTLQGDAYRSHAEQRGYLGNFNLGAIEVSGTNLLARWTQRFSGGSDLRVQTYYDHMRHDDATLYRPREDVFDFEFQHGLTLDAHKLLWGGGYRQAHDDIQPGLFFGFIPASSTQDWSNVFLQDEILLGERLMLTLGAKLERNDFTGTEKLPNLRLAWKLADEQLLWASLSRAVRAPARLDRDIVLPPRPPYYIAGGPDFVSEVAKVFELGYRGQPTHTLSYSLTAFRHDWNRLRSGQTPPDAHVQNMIEGDTYGVEAWAQWEPMPGWRLSGGGTVLRENLRLEPGSTDPVGPRNLGNDPGNQWQLRSAFSLPQRQELDLAVRHVAALPFPAVPAYTAFDLHYGRWLRPDLELSVSGQNLLDGSHPEFDAAPGRSEIGRSVSLRLRWWL